MTLNYFTMITKQNIVEELSRNSVPFDDFGDIVSIERPKLPDLDFHFDTDNSFICVEEGKKTYYPNKDCVFVVRFGLARFLLNNEELGFIL